MVHWHSEYIAIGLLTTVMYYNWPQLIRVKEVNSTSSIQWSMVWLYFDKVAMLHHNRSMYLNINWNRLSSVEIHVQLVPQSIESNRYATFYTSNCHTAYPRNSNPNLTITYFCFRYDKCVLNTTTQCHPFNLILYW